MIITVDHEGQRHYVDADFKPKLGKMSTLCGLWDIAVPFAPSTETLPLCSRCEAYKPVAEIKGGSAVYLPYGKKTASSQ